MGGRERVLIERERQDGSEEREGGSGVEREEGEGEGRVMRGDFYVSAPTPLMPTVACPLGKARIGFQV